MVSFAKSISPPNWNLYLCSEVERYNHEANSVNIKLHILDPCDEKVGYYGRIEKPGLIIRNGVAETTVIIQPSLRDYKTIIMHELAHIAVFRWISYKTKVHRRNRTSAIVCCGKGAKSALPPEVEEAVRRMHGPVFQRMYSVMENRYRKLDR